MTREHPASNSVSVSALNRLVVLETGLKTKTGLKTTFSWSWSRHGLDGLWSWSCLGLGSLGLAMSRTCRTVSRGFVATTSRHAAG